MLRLSRLSPLVLRFAGANLTRQRPMATNRRYRTDCALAAILRKVPDISQRFASVVRSINAAESEPAIDRNIPARAKTRTHFSIRTSIRPARAAFRTISKSLSVWSA